jgi:hypothetical protein
MTRASRSDNTATHLEKAVIELHRARLEITLRSGWAHAHERPRMVRQFGSGSSGDPLRKGRSGAGYLSGLLIARIQHATVKEIDYDFDDFTAIGATFGDRAHRGQMGRGEALLMSQREIVDFEAEWMLANRRAARS